MLALTDFLPKGGFPPAFRWNIAHPFAIRRAMTNRIALWIGLVLLALAAVNFALGLEWHLSLGRRFLDLIRLIAFWR